MLAASLVSALLLASTAPALRVEISSPKTQLSIFEPVKIIVRATALQAVDVPRSVDTTGSPLLQTWIDYGQGYVRYDDYDGSGIGCGVEGTPRSLKVGDRFVETLVLVNGWTDRPTVAFPTPGRFSLRVVARSRPPKNIVLGESNAITFDVVAPEGDDVMLVQRIRDDPSVLRGLAHAKYAALVAQFPASSYLHWGKEAIGMEKWERINSGRYPDSNETFAEIGLNHPLRPHLFRQLADELRGVSWGQFDEERLTLLAGYLVHAGSLTEAKTVWREILERFPDSEAAERAKDLVD